MQCYVFGVNNDIVNKESDVYIVEELKDNRIKIHANECDSVIDGWNFIDRNKEYNNIYYITKFRTLKLGEAFFNKEAWR